MVTTADMNKAAETVKEVLTELEIAETLIKAKHDTPKNSILIPWAANGQKGDNRREGQQKGGNGAGLQGNKQGNYEKGESSGVIKNGSGVAGKNSNGKVNTVVNNSGSLELKKKEEKNKDKVNVNDGKSQAAVQKKDNKGKEEVKVDSKKGFVSDFIGNNPFDVLMEVDIEKWEIRKGKVDLFLKMNHKPSKEVLDGWDEDMMKYYKENVVDESQECEREGILSVSRYKIWKDWAVQHCIDEKLCPQEAEFYRWDLGMQERFINEFVKWNEVDPVVLENSFYLIYSLPFYIDNKIMPPDEIYNRWNTEQRVKFTDEYMTWDGWFFQGKERTINGLCTAIKECVKLKIIGAKFKKGLTFDHVMEEWNLKSDLYEDGQNNFKELLLLMYWYCDGGFLFLILDVVVWKRSNDWSMQMILVLWISNYYEMELFFNGKSPMLLNLKFWSFDGNSVVELDLEMFMELQNIFIMWSWFIGDWNGQMDLLAHVKAFIWFDLLDYKRYGPIFASWTVFWIGITSTGIFLIPHS
ncbi:hypothetical protein L6452_38440 [Arctium lappa]|uniref:Uncharacterized protein n=1 Tax=Arctium lappa TaxID=4217 RepID=A0ACB8Y5R1_ARCLA|nr:hypothetical protein L6452_38440 [Arctium lappa]